MRLNEIAAAIHRDMVTDERNGYSWEERCGQQGAWKTLVIDGREYSYQLGDRDCSSSVIEAWQLALMYTAFAGALDAASYTGNMRKVFYDSGLFDLRFDGNADVGDLWLNDSAHVAMEQGDGLISEFSWGDNGAYGNRRGDQSGHESAINPWYSRPWNVVLHYNGKADGSIEEGFDNMAECIFICDDDHEGYSKGDYVYWTPASGFSYLENIDCVSLLKTCNPGIKEIRTGSGHPWIMRAKQATRPSVAEETYGKHD